MISNKNHLNLSISIFTLNAQTDLLVSINSIKNNQFGKLLYRKFKDISLYYKQKQNYNNYQHNA